MLTSRRGCLKTLIMTRWLLYLFIKSMEAFHSLNPLDLSCKKLIDEYRLITDRSNYIISPDHPLITIRAAIGLDDEHISSSLTELWYEQIDQQFVTLQSSEYLFQIKGELNKDDNHSWDLKFSSLMNKSGIQSLTNISLSKDLSFNGKSILNIQSTIFNKQIDLLIRTNETDSCSYSNSSMDFALCCGLCSTTNTCPEIKILHEHSRYDIIVSNRGVMVPRALNIFPGEFICSLFPSDEIHRFWSTITHAMNIDQIADKHDMAIVQHSYGIVANFFYYSFYPFHHWLKQMMNFHFIDMLLVPHQQLAIFELNECDQISCQLSLRIYEYKGNETMEFNHQLSFPEIILARNVSSGMYFHLYFDMLANILYLIGQENIYASKNYGEKLIRIWTSDLSLNDSIILNPMMFSDTGHIAFIYRLNNHSSSYQYFAVFSKTGAYYAWRTRLFHSSILMDTPFFFDASGSFYFNTTPPLLVILATEQSLVATSNLLVNDIPGLFFVQETDLNRLFIFCSLSPWDQRFELIGSTLRFDKVGLFFIINMDIFSTEFAFCLQTSRLDDDSHPTSRQCQLTISPISRRIHLQVSGCVWSNMDENSTIILAKSANILLDQIVNNTVAYGRMFDKRISNPIQVQQWNIIKIQKVEQILDRCLLKNLDPHHHRPSFIQLPPTMIYPLTNGDQFVTKNIQFLMDNDYTLSENNTYLIASSFNNRKAIIYQEFLRSQLSCYLPLTRTMTFVTKCLTNIIIRARFEINSNLGKLIPIDPPINFQLNRYQAGFNSVIVYNLHDEKYSVCDGWKNCSCISSLISSDFIHCAEQFYTLDSTVNNHVQMKLWMGKGISTNKSLFLIEEISKRTDFQLIDHVWTKKMRDDMWDLFRKDFHQLTANEIRILDLISTEKNLFFGPNLHLKLLDEGLYHFRLTHLWGDQFCLTSTDLLILMISNTATFTSYLWNYFLACIFLLIIMFILWIIYVIFYERMYCSRLKPPTFFIQRSVPDHTNLEILVQIREQSSKLLPYQDQILEKPPYSIHR